MGAGATIQLVAHYARRRGVRPLLGKLARRLGGSERWYVTCGDLTAWAHAPRRQPSIDIRAARPADLPALERLGRQRPDTLRAWMRPGQFLFVAEHAGEIIGYRALAPKPHPWVAGYFRLRPDQIYGLDLFTHPAWRRRGVTYELMAYANPRLLAQGYREVISIQRVDNHESIATTRARGIARLGVLERRTFFGRVRFRFEPSR